eukprot:10444127-Alexandrium_andersonii.AAC.1
MTWWCASCHGAAHAAKNLLNSRCMAFGARAAKAKNEVRARNWQRRTQLISRARADEPARWSLRA